MTVLATNDVSFNPDFDSTMMPAGMLMLGVVGLVLLVACANLANMMLARAANRAREIAIRVALGAGRVQLVGQLLTESVVLALAGGISGMVLATWLSGLVGRFQPPLPIDVTFSMAPDWRVLLFTMIAAGITGVVFGLIPALRASQPDLVPALKDTGEGTGRGKGRVELRDALVVVQVAVSIVLLVAGALMIRSLAAAQRVDMGYRHRPHRLSRAGDGDERLRRRTSGRFLRVRSAAARGTARSRGGGPSPAGRLGSTLVTVVCGRPSRWS